LTAPFVPLLGLPKGATALLVGVLLAGVPEVLLLAAGALLGKKGLADLLGRVKGVLRSAFVPREVSRGRYHAGLALLFLSIVPLYLYGYAPSLLPGGAVRLWTLIGADLSCLAAVWLMGEEFWIRVRPLFVWRDAGPRLTDGATPQRSDSV
jgi:hypothetical protein